MATAARGSKLSVALCTHNGAQFIASQMQSILDQTVPVDEIVLSDDASDDDTVAIATEVVARHASDVSLIVLSNRPALGVTHNFERALNATTGDLVALADQDDVWMPHRIERAVEQFAARPRLDLLHADARLVDAAGEPLGGTLLGALEATGREIDELHSGLALNTLLRRNLVTGATTMLRRRLIERAVPFPSGWVHDEWLAVIAAATGEVDVIESPLIDYRQHGGNQIGATRPTLAVKVGRLLEPRRARNTRLATNARTLVQRLEQLRVGGDTLALARGKLAHELARDALPTSRLRRIAPVAREVRTGRYAAYGRGRPDVLRDLVQPVD